MQSEPALILSQVLEKEAEATRQSEVKTTPPYLRQILRFVKSGFARASALLRLAILLLVANLLFALILTLPLYGMLDDSLSTSLRGDRSFGVPDANWFVGFLQSTQSFLNDLSSTILWVGLLYMVMNTMLTAGLLEVLYSEHPFSLRRFFGGIVTHGANFLRLFGLSLVVYFVVFLVFNKLLGWGLDRWTGDWASEAGTFVVSLLKNILLGVVLLAAIMIFDYAKIRVVMERSGHVLAETIWALRFVWNRRWLTLGVFYALGVISVVLILIYMGMDALLTPKSLWVAVPAFLVQQAFMFSRMWLRVAFVGAEMEVYKQMAR
ncbi:MAG: hypothetical protein HY314_01370 [Acidobacteria bacterium]|nr:hypothetical protein [Acidobacteriota bacterium]